MSEREARTREVADMCAVKSTQKRVTDVENTVTQRFEARACEMETVTVRLTESKDLKFQPRYEIVNQQEHMEPFKGLQVNKAKINDENRLENYCVTAEKYRNNDEVNQTEIEDKKCSENYCVNSEKYRDADEAKAVMIDKMLTLPNAGHGGNESNKARFEAVQKSFFELDARVTKKRNCKSKETDRGNRKQQWQRQEDAEQQCQRDAKQQTVEVPQGQCIDRVVGVAVDRQKFSTRQLTCQFEMRHQAHMVQKLRMMRETPQLQCIDEVDRALVARQSKKPAGAWWHVRHDRPDLHLRTVSYVHLQPTVILTVVVGSSRIEKYA